MSGKIDLFTFGYWGWGSQTKLLLDITAEAERARGFEPPCFVDLRISRSVRATGFRDAAFEILAGPKRYVWIPALGNRRVRERREGIEIDRPEATRELVDLARDRAARGQRLLCFCACEYAEGCHRTVVARLAEKEAASRGFDLAATEWWCEGIERPRAISTSTWSRIASPTR